MRWCQGRNRTTDTAIFSRIADRYNHLAAKQCFSRRVFQQVASKSRATCSRAESASWVYLSRATRCPPFPRNPGTAIFGALKGSDKWRFQSINTCRSSRLNRHDGFPRLGLNGFLGFWTQLFARADLTARRRNRLLKPCRRRVGRLVAEERERPARLLILAGHDRSSNTTGARSRTVSSLGRGVATAQRFGSHVSSSLQLSR